MKCINIFYFFLIILILYIILILNYFKNKNNKPHLYKNLNIKNLSYLDFDYFKKNHGDEYIYISYSKSNSVDMVTPIKKIKLIDYCNTLMKDKNWYFKTEDEYDFLNIIGIKKNVLKEFDLLFDVYKKYQIIHKDCSFWMGSKGSTTGWHTDIDDLSYLYVIKGKKKIQLISPKYNYAMYERNIYTENARWSNIDFQNIDYKKYPKFKNVQIYTFILNEGDSMYIPKNWWHCVENLEDTIGITYKIYRWDQAILTFISEIIRKIFYYCKGYKIYDMNEIILNTLSRKDYNELVQKIINNRYNY